MSQWREQAQQEVEGLSRRFGEVSYGMATGFDPYHRWLSIPPSEQPPHHYRLLGLQVFESAPAVIENAAERQSRHVRENLQSPLRPYAVNLLREIEIARLCLLDREAKLAYDSCLRQRQEFQAPANSPRVPQERPRGASLSSSADIGSGAGFSPAESISFSAPPEPSIHTYRSHHRKKRRGSPLAFLVLWLAGGAMGLLAGYAILCMIDPQYDFLHVMFAEEGGGQNAAATIPVPRETAKNRENVAVKSNRQERPRRAETLTTEQTRKTVVEQQSVNPTRPNWAESVSDMPDASEVGAEAAQEAVSDLKPVVLPFDFKKRVLRVISMPEVESYDELRCNIQGSAELHMNPLVDFPLGGKQEIVFNLGMGNLVAGFEVSFLRRNKAVIVEISPKYRLPSGDDEGWYKTAGLKKAKQLANLVTEATNARDALPGLSNQLQPVIREIQLLTAMVDTPTNTAGVTRHIAARHRLQERIGQRDELQALIGVAAKLNANLPMLEADLAAVKQLGEWSGEIAESATLSVCIHKDGTGLVAEAR